MNTNQTTQINKTKRLRGVLATVAGLAVLLGATTACEPAGPVGHGVPNGGGIAPGYDRAVITWDAGVSNGGVGNHPKGRPFDDDYIVTPNGSLSVYAPLSNGGGNFREALVSTNAPLSVDQESCVTWHGATKTGPQTLSIKKETSDIQAGVVLRSRTDEGVTRLIMVTGNIMFGIRNAVNVHLVDTSKADPYEQIAQMSWMNTVGNDYTKTPIPWRFCARVQGYSLTYKAWSTKLPEPAWDDPTNSMTIDIRTNQKTGNASSGNAYGYAGKPGIFVGHLKRGEETKFTGHDTKILTGGAGDVLWNSAQTWASGTEAALVGAPGAASRSTGTTVELARLATIKKASVGASNVALSKKGRSNEGAEIFERMLNRSAGSDGRSLTGGSALSYVRYLATTGEFSGSLSDDQYVQRLYERFLGRSGAQVHVNTWVAKVKKQGRSATAVEFYKVSESSNRTIKEVTAEVWGRAPTGAEQVRLRSKFESLKFDSTLLKAALLAEQAPSL